MAAPRFVVALVASAGLFVAAAAGATVPRQVLVDALPLGPQHHPMTMHVMRQSPAKHALLMPVIQNPALLHASPGAPPFPQDFPPGYGPSLGTKAERIKQFDRIDPWDGTSFARTGEAITAFKAPTDPWSGEPLDAPSKAQVRADVSDPWAPPPAWK